MLHVEIMFIFQHKHALMINKSTSKESNVEKMVFFIIILKLLSYPPDEPLRVWYDSPNSA